MTVQNGTRLTLPLGKAKKPWIVIRRQVCEFRRQLEDAVASANGGIDLRLAKLVRTACTAFESAQRIRRVLAYNPEPGADGGLEHSTWLSYDSALQAREQSCDKAMQALGLDRDAFDPWAIISQPAAAATATLPHDHAANRDDGHPGGDRASEATPDALPGIQARHENVNIPGFEDGK